MDLVLKLREIRRMRGLTQKDVARLSGVGEKTISSFETGQRIGALKLAQLKRLLSVYGLTESDFFSGSIEKQIAPWELDEQQMATVKLMDDLHALRNFRDACGVARIIPRALTARYGAARSRPRRNARSGSR